MDTTICMESAAKTKLFANKSTSLPVPMDKHARKRTAKWEMKKAKECKKLEEAIQKQIKEDAYEQVRKFAETYEADPGDAINTVLRQYAEWGQLFIPPVPPFIMPLRINWIRYVIFKEDSLQHMIDVPASIERIRSVADNMMTAHYVDEMDRHFERNFKIQDELLETVRGLETVRKCRAIKEELMMRVWHPSRVERLLETYGWWDM